MIEPSTARVGPLPPYAIRADGVGPYKVGEKLSDLLEQLASGPRIALFEIPGLVHRNVIRAEDDTILVGGEQASTATFVAVVGAEVARTESGLHVGSTRAELIEALGPPLDEPERARDPRLIVPRGLPSLRVVLDGGRVAAIVVATAAPPLASKRAGDCERPAATRTAFGACLTAGGELIELRGDELVVRTADQERALGAPIRAPGLVFAAPIRTATEPRDELVVVTRSDEAAVRSWWVAAYRFDGARLVRSVDATQLYQLSSANARWIGAELHDVELYLELTSAADGFDVGGLLTTLRTSGTATKIGDVVVISPASVARRRLKATATEPGDGKAAGSSQAGRPAATPDDQDASDGRD
jgi:hypothetical protein